MGFTTTINPYTNREVLCCDFCGGYVGDNKTKFVRKKKCPFEYCQAYATCDNCWNKNNKELHLKNHCDVYAKEYEEREANKQKILNEGNFIVISALRHDFGIKVIFRNKDDQELAFWIDEDKYPLKNYSEITTLKEYENKYNEEGLLLQECKNIDIYSGE